MRKLFTKTRNQITLWSSKTLLTICSQNTSSWIRSRTNIHDKRGRSAISGDTVKKMNVLWQVVSCDGYWYFGIVIPAATFRKPSRHSSWQLYTISRLNSQKNNICAYSHWGVRLGIFILLQFRTVSVNLWHPVGVCVRLSLLDDLRQRATRNTLMIERPDSQ